MGKRIAVDGTEKTVERQVWGFWPTVGFGLLVGTVFVALHVLVLIVVVVCELGSNQHRDPAQLAEELSSSGFVLSLSTVTSAAVGIALLLLIVKLRRGSTIREYLALNPVNGKTLLGLAALSAGFIMLADGLTLLLGRPIVHEFMVEAYTTQALPGILWVALIGAAPAFEEIFFRGFLFEGFQRSRIGSGGAIVLTTLVWASIHLQYGLYELGLLFALMHFYHY